MHGHTFLHPRIGPMTWLGGLLHEAKFMSNFTLVFLVAIVYITFVVGKGAYLTSLIILIFLILHFQIHDDCEKPMTFLCE